MVELNFELRGMYVRQLLAAAELARAEDITRAFEDHSALAECRDGATYALDPDGNGQAGLSYNPGGQWHDIS